jgi:ribonuclease P protein component
VSEAFPKERRLRRRRDYLAVQAQGKQFRGTYFILVTRPRAECESRVSRVGITVSKRVGNAVTRNRLKRLVREFARRSEWIAPGWDAVVIARARAAELRSYRDAAAELRALGKWAFAC